MSNFKARALAYILDMFLVSICLLFISSIFTRSSNYYKLNDELTSITDKYINGEVSTKTYIYNQAEITRDIDRENVFMNLVQAFIVVGYFIMLPYYNDGKTIGKKLFKIKIVSNDDSELTYNKLIARALIIDGLGYLLLTMSTVYILPGLGYYIFTCILSLVEFVIFIVNMIMIFKNSNHRCVHDIWSDTKVINE